MRMPRWTKPTASTSRREAAESEGGRLLQQSGQPGRRTAPSPDQGGRDPLEGGSQRNQRIGCDGVVSTTEGTFGAGARSRGNDCRGGTRGRRIQGGGSRSDHAPCSLQPLPLLSQRSAQ